MTEPGKVKLNKNRIVRFHILLICLLSSFALVFLITVNFYIASQNESRVHSLQDTDYPAIQALILFKQGVEDYRDAISSAISLQNAFLVDEAEEKFQPIADYLDVIEALLPARRSELTRIKQLFAHYTKESSRLAHELIKSPEQYPDFSRRAGTLHQNFTSLQHATVQLLNAMQQAYVKKLDKITLDFNQANLVASLAGIFTIGALILLSWVVSNRVIRELQQTDNLKEAFLATVSHELRTPMNGIIGALNLIKDDVTDEQQKKYLDAALQSSIAMTKTVDEILTFSDFIAGRPKISLSSFSLYRLLAYTLMITHQECEKKGIQFHCNLDSLKSITLTTDKQKILHVLRRILENAVKFSRGDISFRFTYWKLKHSDLPYMAHFEVEDNGPGVKRELIDEMFRPFHQLDSSFTRKHGGLGIGLTICKIIAETLNGALIFQNKPDGSGAIVSFQIPCHITFDDETESETPTVLLTREERQPVKAHRCVLIAEDNPVNQLVLKSLVEKMGYETLVAKNGKEAVEKVRQTDIDLILMDCQMPEMDGFEATRQVRSMENSKRNIPIIAVTANARDTDREKCKEAGMNEFISKPVDHKVLKDYLARYLSH